MNQSNHEIRRMIYTTEKPGATELHHGDCLKLMPSIPDGSVDMILADLPYGVTANHWDSVIPMTELWEQYRRIVKPNGAIALTATQPFATDLIVAARDIFRYDLIWEKVKATGFLHANQMPLRKHESVLVFYNRLPTFNPVKRAGGKPFHVKRRSTRNTSNYNSSYDPTAQLPNLDGSRYPTSVLDVRYEAGFFNASSNGKRTIHPTQKPIALMEYLIRTYTNEGEVVLDNCMGSGTTGVAAVQCGRRFIGIELDPTYFAHASKRIEEKHLQIGSMIRFAP